jgi:hypothetical protein
MAKAIVVGSVLTCQFGNKTDSSGFEKSTDVTVLGAKEMVGGTLYLVKKHGEDLIGRALVPNLERCDCTSDLICMSGMPYKADSQLWPQSLEAAVAMIF